MDSTVSSGPSAVLKTAARAAAEGAVVAAIAALISRRIVAADQFKAVSVGLASAWAASSSSVAWLLWARGRSMRTFWWAFGGGMALRAAALAVLFIWGFKSGTPLEALLLSYVFGLLALLLTLEIRHLRIS